MSSLFSPLRSDSSWSLVAASSSHGEGVKTSWLILVLKVGSIVSCGSSVSIVDESFTSVLGFESGLVVRSGYGIRYMYSPSMSSLSNMDKMKSASVDVVNTSTKVVISSYCF